MFIIQHLFFFFVRRKKKKKKKKKGPADDMLSKQASRVVEWPARFVVPEREKTGEKRI